MCMSKTDVLVKQIIHRPMDTKHFHFLFTNIIMLLFYKKTVLYLNV